MPYCHMNCVTYKCVGYIIGYSRHRRCIAFTLCTHTHSARPFKPVCLGGIGGIGERHSYQSACAVQRFCLLFFAVFAMPSRAANKAHAQWHNIQIQNYYKFIFFSLGSASFRMAMTHMLVWKWERVNRLRTVILRMNHSTFFAHFVYL